MNRFLWLIIAGVVALTLTWPLNWLDDWIVGQGWFPKNNLYAGLNGAVFAGIISASIPQSKPRKIIGGLAGVRPDDLAALGLESGALVTIRSPHATILGVAEPAPELRRGVISMAHCYGDAPAHDGAVRDIGSNTGRLIDNESHFDPHTGIPRMSAIPVAIERAATP